MMSSVKVGGATISFYALGVDVHVLIRVGFMHFTRRLSVCQVASIGAALALVPDGHPKLLHLWPVKLLQAGRSDYDDSGVMAMRAAASFRR